MKRQIKLRLEMGERVDTFGKRSDLTLTPKLTALFTDLRAKLALMRSSGESQESGKREFRGGVAERRLVARELREAMRDIAEIAQALDAAGTLPGGAEKFRLPTSRMYQTRLAAARAFVQDVEPVKALFIERGLDADFAADLDALADEFDVVTGRKNDGKAEQVNGTTGLDASADALHVIVQELRAIMRVHLKNNPALLAAWQCAAREENWRTLRKASQPAPTPPSPPPSTSDSAASSPAPQPEASLPSAP